MNSTSTQQQDNDMPDHSECMRLLQLVLDDEASPEERKIFDEQVCNCMPYYEIYEVDKKIKQLVKQNCVHNTVPEGMASEIKARIFQKSN